MYVRTLLGFQWCERLLNWIIVFKHWKNIYSVFCATHNVMAVDMAQFKFNLKYKYFQHFKSNQQNNQSSSCL